MLKFVQIDSMSGEGSRWAGFKGEDCVEELCVFFVRFFNFFK